MFGVSRIRASFILLVSMLWSSFVFAGNGMYMISHGGRYGGLAGATTAVGGSVMDLHSSPALIGIDRDSILETGLRLNYAENKYNDEFLDPDPQYYYSNNKKSYIRAPLPYLGFSLPVGDRFAFATAFYLVGGGGGQFNGITRLTPTGSSANEFLGYDLAYGGQQKKLKESVFARMMHSKISSGLSYEIGKLRAGVVISGGFSQMKMRQLLHDPSDNFELPGSGLQYKSDPAYALTGGLGASWDFTNDFRLAYSWSGPTVFHMDGEMRTNVGNPDYYHHNQVSMRMAWPEQHRFGIRKAFGNIALSLDIGYINWSSYLNTLKFRLDQPAIRTPFGFDSSLMLLNLHLRDQIVYSIGLEYTLNKKWTFRTGYNYARANAGAEGVNPLFSITTEHHLAAGIGIASNDWVWDLALEYAAPGRLDGGNTSNWDIAHAVFGPEDIRTPNFNHSKNMQAVALILSATYKWESR